MVEETIQSIRETEGKADSVIRDAQEEGKRLCEAAERKASEVKTEILKAAQQERADRLEQAKKDAAKEEEAARKEQEGMIRDLKARAAGMEAEAVDLVVSNLV